MVFKHVFCAFEEAVEESRIFWGVCSCTAMWKTDKSWFLACGGWPWSGQIQRLSTRKQRFKKGLRVAAKTQSFYAEKQRVRE